MNREQEIKILKPMLDSFVDYANITMKIEDDNNADALEMAVEALEQPEIIYCKDCAHYHTDVFGGELGRTGIWKNIIVAHNACDRWTKDMNCVDPDGFCFLAERRAENADVNT